MFRDGQINNLALFTPAQNAEAVVYLYREIDLGEATDLPVSLGSDDTLTVWLNGKRLLAQNVSRSCAPDQAKLTLKLRPGRNALLMKVGNGDSNFAFYFRAARALARFMSIHPVNIAQKTEVMVEHFHTFVRHKIGGRAKDMVVTSSRLHAVRYKQAFDKYIDEKGYTDIKSLVAFSGTVPDPDAPGRSPAIVKYT